MYNQDNNIYTRDWCRWLMEKKNNWNSICYILWYIILTKKEEKKKLVICIDTWMDLQLVFTDFLNNYVSKNLWLNNCISIIFLISLLSITFLLYGYIFACVWVILQEYQYFVSIFLFVVIFYWEMLIYHTTHWYYWLNQPWNKLYTAPSNWAWSFLIITL